MICKGQGRCLFSFQLAWTHLFLVCVHDWNDDLECLVLGFVYIVCEFLFLSLQYQVHEFYMHVAHMLRKCVAPYLYCKSDLIKFKINVYVIKGFEFDSALVSQREVLYTYSHVMM